MSDIVSPAVHHKQLQPFVTQLQQSIDGTLDFSDAGVALYTSDASNYRQIPLGVVYPKHAQDIVAINSLCREHSLPVLMRGGGTSQNGQSVNNAVILDCSRYMNQVLELDAEARSAWVQPGIVCDVLKAEAEKVGLTFGPDPATHSRCTLGGMIGNNSCGPRSMLAGKTVENVLELEILTPGGEQFVVGPTSDTEYERILQAGGERADIYRRLRSIAEQYADDIRQHYPDIKRRVSGYNLDQLLPENGFNIARALVGTEGTCVLILRARVRLIGNPAHRHLTVLGFADIYTAGDSVPDIMPFSPIAMEGLDWTIIGGLKERGLQQREIALLPEGKAWILVELAGATVEALQSKVTQFLDTMRSNPLVTEVVSIDDPAQVADVWRIREQGASATAVSLHPDDPDPIIGWEDTAVDPMRLGDYLRAFQALVEKYNYKTSLYGHFGDGCLHARITFDTRSEQGVKDWRAFSEEIARLVIDYGGSLSGEHGDGQAKAEFLPLMFGDRLVRAFGEFKAVFDPECRMNPRKVVDPYRMDENLRYGPDYSLHPVESPLAWPEAGTVTEGALGLATERCIGMGKCRAATGPMCPSYQVTGEERYSPRGRAHLIHELLRGDILQQGWDDPDLADSLSLCLGCKSCKTECPTQVDIAAFKAEFHHRHHARHGASLVDRVLTHLDALLAWGSKMPKLFNALQRSAIGGWARKRAGFSDDKALPELAGQTFMSWAAANAERSAEQSADQNDQQFYWFGLKDNPVVVLFVDTFNNYFDPDVLTSAVRVLTATHHQVAVARRLRCCGRPQYEQGRFELARERLHWLLDTFSASSVEEAPIVVLEPSCQSLFADDLLRLFPDASEFERLRSRVVSIESLLMDTGAAFQQCSHPVVLHRHCHLKSRDNQRRSQHWFASLLPDLQVPDASCCGMAGTFGLQQKTRDVALSLYKRRLQPAVDSASDHAAVVSDGFSCREHMRAQSGRQVLHPVQILDRQYLGDQS